MWVNSFTVFRNIFIEEKHRRVLHIKIVCSIYYERVLLSLLLNSVVVNNTLSFNIMLM